MKQLMHERTTRIQQQRGHKQFYTHHRYHCHLVKTPIIVSLCKGKAEHLYSALHCIQTTLKRPGMDHTVEPAKNTMPAFTS